MTRGFYIILAAQFFSALADNALLFAAIALLAQIKAPEWQTPVLQQFFVFAYIVLALGGGWKLWRCRNARPAILILVVYILVRTAFLTTLETPEPRYTLVCFPALLALGAQLFTGKGDTQILNIISSPTR